jgi:hypothetical protein
LAWAANILSIKIVISEFSRDDFTAALASSMIWEVVF